MSETKTESKKDLDLKMVPLKIELAKPFINFIEEYLKFFGSHYTIEDYCRIIICNETKIMFNDLKNFIGSPENFLDTSDFFKKWPYLGIVSFDELKE